MLEYPGGYTRSVGTALSRYFTGLRAGRIVGVRTADGRVMVPPTEYDPDTGAALDEFVEVGPAGVVDAWTWVAEPVAGKHHLDQAVRVRAGAARRRRRADGARGRRRVGRRDERRHARDAALGAPSGSAT